MFAMLELMNAGVNDKAVLRNRAKYCLRLSVLPAAHLASAARIFLLTSDHKA